MGNNCLKMWSKFQPNIVMLFGSRDSCFLSVYCCYTDWNNKKQCTYSICTSIECPRGAVHTNNWSNIPSVTLLMTAKSSDSNSFGESFIINLADPVPQPLNLMLAPTRIWLELSEIVLFVQCVQTVWFSPRWT